VFLKDHEGDVGADVNGDFELTRHVNVLEVEDGVPISGKITLNAREGRFITKIPKIQRWDRVYVEITDRKGKQFKTVLHVRKRKKIRTSSGLELRLTCPHQSSNLLTQTVSKPNIRSSGKDAMTDIVNSIRTNRGAKDPLAEIKIPFDQVLKNGIRLSEALANDYTFESIKAEQAIKKVLDKEGGVVEAGGAFQFHFGRFQSLYVHPNDADLDKVAIQVFEQGFKDNSGVFNSTPSVTIKKASLITDPKTTLLETDSSLEPEQGTNLIAIGHKASGSYLKDFMKFQGAKDTFRSAKLWVVNRDYKEGALVVDATTTFECISDHTSSFGNRPLSSVWLARTFTKSALYNAGTTYSKDILVRFGEASYKSLEAGNLGNQPDLSPTKWIEIFYQVGVDYSPLTKDKAQYWINAGAGWIHANSVNNNLTGVVDHNVVIKDDLHNRTWVDTVEANSGNLAGKNVLKNGQPFDTLRVLVNTTGVGDFAGNDPNNVPFANNIAEYRTDVGQGGPNWFVFRVSRTDDEVFSYREGESWTWQPCDAVGAHVDGAGQCLIGVTPQNRSTVWVKGSYILDKLFGLIGDFGIFTVNQNFTCVHPLARNPGGEIKLGNEEIIPELGSTTSAVFAEFDPQDISANSRMPYSFYMGLNFAFPWPRNNNAIPHGSVSIGEKIDLPTMDFFNMHLTHEAKREWFGPQVEDYYPIQGFAWFEKVFERQALTNFTKLAGDYNFDLWLVDRNDNKVTMSYVHSVNNIVTPQDTPIGKAKIQRSVPGIATFVGAKQPEILDIFDWRNVVRGGIENTDVFDEQGRYRYAGLGLTVALPFPSRFSDANLLKLSIDAFRMTKPLVATNVRTIKPDRNIEPKKLREEEIISYAQLRGFVESSELIFNFQRDEYPLKTQLRCDIPFGDPVYYEDNEVIDETTDGKPNTIKAVANKIIYSISKPAAGPGGFLRTVELVTRLFP